MPLPTPQKDETQADFISRCMDDETMKNEYDDSKQRAAVCHQRWKDKDHRSASSDCERRAFPVDALGLEERAASTLPRIKGHAAVFGSLSRDLGGFREVVRRGAFEKSLKTKADIRALVEHDRARLLARTRSGTLGLVEDDRGLKVDIDTPNTTVGRDITESIRRGDVDAMSFGFVVQKDKWSMVDGDAIRELQEVELLEVSPVSSPAYTDTDVSIARRSLDTWRESGEPDVVPMGFNDDPESVARQKIVEAVKEL
jgi:HK97 family phage prohead protease